MKPVLVLLILVVCISPVRAQEPQTISRTILKLSPQHFIDNSLKVGVERFNETYTSSFAFFVTGKLQNQDDGFDRYGYDGIAGELQLRKYLSPMKAVMSKKNKDYAQGVYGALYAQGGTYRGEMTDMYSNFDPVTGFPTGYDTYDYEEQVVNFGLGFTIGYQKTLWQVMFLEGFVGGGIQFADRKVSGNIPPNHTYYGYDGIIDPGYRGILPKIGLTIGLGL
jgi:hypothetical protein